MMTMPNLTQKHCVPCEGGVPMLMPEEVGEYLKQVPGWTRDLTSTKISRTFRFKDFVEAMKFVNKVAELAEEEGHHPNLLINYSRVTLTLWTHAIGGLSENDFILAAKIHALGKEHTGDQMV